jgi:penicillin-binding protein 1A
MNIKPVLNFLKGLKTVFANFWSHYKAFNAKVKKTPLIVRIAVILAKIVIAILLFLGAVDINFLWLFGKSPKLHDLNNPNMEIASELYSADSVLIGKYFDKNRTPVKYNEISPLLIKTLVATEDQRFYQHSGIDFKSTFSIFWYMAQGKRRGGSTITQQLVKNLFNTRSNYSKGLLGYIPVVRTIIYKTKEWINALKIEAYYSKEDILTLYLNTVDFGNNSFGIHTASKIYFDTEPDSLNESQCAVLVGMLKAPSYYSPILHPKNALERRNTVLGLMEQQGIISAAKADSVKATPITVVYNTKTDESTNYFSIAVARYLKAWLKENGYDLYRDGLKIYTTIDSRLQKYAEEATAEQMKLLQRNFDRYIGDKAPWQDEHGKEIAGFMDKILKQEPEYKILAKKFNGNTDSIYACLNKKHKIRIFTWHGDRDTMFSHIDSLCYFNRFLHGSFVSMSPANGHILTWVGDIDYDYFKFDHVNQAKRQPGSTFKAFIYTAAIDNGYGPCDEMTDSPVSIEYTEKGEQKTWSPQNVSCKFSGDTFTLKHAFARSINSIAIKLTKEFGWRKVIEYAHKMGITTKLEDVPSVAIGSSDVSLYELVDAYCTIVNGGYRVDPMMVVKITDKNGNVIKVFNTQKTRVLSEETAFLMVQMLRGGMSEPHATTQALFAYDLFKSKIEFGGKTGTSQNYSDGWFVGVTPKIIGGAWVGGEYRSVHFHSNTQGEGCHTALPIFGKFMEKVLNDSRYDTLKVRFPKPDIKITKNYSCHTILKEEPTRGDSVSVDSITTDL